MSFHRRLDVGTIDARAAHSAGSKVEHLLNGTAAPLDVTCAYKCDVVSHFQGGQREYLKPKHLDSSLTCDAEGIDLAVCVVHRHPIRQAGVGDAS